MTWASDAELDAFVLRFQWCTVPKAEWTHHAHLAVGTWHVQRLGAAAALPVLRAGIRALNESNGVANTETNGYHETITCAYVHLIAGFLAGGPPATTLALRVQALLGSPLARKDALLGYYSRDLLFSPRARRQWILPDLQPLPSLNGELASSGDERGP